MVSAYDEIPIPPPIAMAKHLRCIQDVEVPSRNCAIPVEESETQLDVAVHKSSSSCGDAHNVIHCRTMYVQGVDAHSVFPTAANDTEIANGCAKTAARYR